MALYAKCLVKYAKQSPYFKYEQQMDFSETLHDWVIFELDIYNTFDKDGQKYYVQVVFHVLVQF